MKDIPHATGGKTMWHVEIGRPVAHEHRRDGTQITHICPGGGKSRLVNEVLRDLRLVKQA